MSRDDKHENQDAAAHALDALDAAERAAIEQRLAHNPRLAAEVAAHREVAARLGEATQPSAPPPALRASILSAIAGMPQADSAGDADDVPVAEQADEPAPGSPEHASGPAVPGTSEPRDRAERQPPTEGPAQRRAARRWFEQPAALIVAAAVAALLVFSGGALVGSVVTDRVTAASDSEQLARIYAADDMQRQSVTSDGVAATLVWSPSLGQSALVFDEVPPLDAGTVYEAWYIGDEGPVAAGTFETRASGTAWHVLDGTMTPGVVVGVTVEPDGGSEQPTSDPILAIETS